MLVLPKERFMSLLTDYEEIRHKMLATGFKHNKAMQKNMVISPSL